MIFWYDKYVIFFVSGAALLLSCFGLWLIAIMPGIERWSKNFFRVLFAVLVLLCLTGLIDATAYNYNITVATMYFIMFLEIMLFSLPMPMMTVYLLHCCGESIRSSRLFHAAAGLWIVFVVMLGSVPFNGGIFYYFTPDRHCYRGTWYPVMIIPVIGVMLLTTVGIIRYRQRLSRKEFFSFLIALLPLTGVLLVQMFIQVYPLIDICVVLASLSMYSLILSDQVEQDLRRQREIANQQASIMVLQMRPHFIYNTMTSI